MLTEGAVVSCHLETDDYNAETLLPLIKNYIIKRIIIVRDGCVAYYSLKDTGYVHNTLSPAESFMDCTDASVHTHYY